MITLINKQPKSALKYATLEYQASCMLKALNYEDFSLSIVFVNDETIHDYNKQYRQKDAPTDILSFPFHQLQPGERISAPDEESKSLGDIIIAPDYAAHDCREKWDHDFSTHMTMLLAHGIAHLLGYDHETDEEFTEMQKVEKLLITSTEH